MILKNKEETKRKVSLEHIDKHKSSQLPAGAEETLVL